MKHSSQLYARLLIIITFSLITGLFNISSAQTNLYSEDFGTGGSFPNGWSSSNGNWANSTVVSSSGYTGSSGGSNAWFQNYNTDASELIYSSSLSTVGYENITVLWGARLTNLATITVVFSWSSDGSTWNPVTFTNVNNNSTWALVNGGTRISLPAGAEGIADLQFKITATASNGFNNTSYRVDDFTVEGCPGATTTITYGDSPLCPTYSTPHPVSITGVTGGTFSSTAGLSLNSSSGEITASTSTPATYTVTYTIAASGGCAEYSTTADVIIASGLPVTPTVTSPVNYCQNDTPSQLTASGSYLIWNPVSLSGSVGGTTVLNTGTWVDDVWPDNNKKTNFTTIRDYVTITTVKCYVPSWQSVTGLVLGIFDSGGTEIATSSTTTTHSGDASGLTITNTFNYAITAAGDYSIGISAGSGILGAETSISPLTEGTSSITLTGVSSANNWCFNDIQFTVSGSPVAPTPSTASVGTTDHTVNQTFVGCESSSATISVIVEANDISQLPTSNLIAYYKFNGDALDETENNDGTLQNSPSQTADRFDLANSAYAFDGSSQYVSTSKSYTNPTDFSISIWFKTSTSSGGRLIGFGNAQTGSSTSYDRHVYMNDAGQIYFGVYTGSVVTVNSPLSYNDDEWHLATATLSSSAGMVLYIDGEAVDSDPNTSAENYTGWWRMGYDNNNGWTSQPSSFYFGGSLDDVVIHHTALNSTEVVTLYTSPDGAGNDGPFCDGETVNLSSTTVSGATYSWTGPNSYTSSSQNPSFTYTTADAGVYAVDVTTSGGCSSTAYTRVETAPSATISYDGSPYTTSGGTATVTFSGTTGGTYSSTAGLSINSTSGDVNLGASTPGTYTVEYTIVDGCPAEAEIMIVENKTFTGTGNFSDPARWTGGTLPAAGDNLIIDGSCAVDDNVGTDNVEYGTLTIGTATGRTLSWVSSGTNTLNVSSVSAGAGASTLDMTNGGMISLRSTWDNTNLTFIPGSGTIDVESGISLPTGVTTVNNLTINASTDTVGIGVNTTVNGDLSITTGTLDLGDFTLDRASAGGTLSLANGTSLLIGGTKTLPDNYSTHSFGATSTVEYYGTDQAVAALNSAQKYGDLILSGSGTKTMSGTAYTIAGDLSLSETVVANLTSSATAEANVDIASGNQLVLSPTGDLTVSGTLTNGAGNSGLLIESSAAGTGSLIHSTAGVDGSVERYMDSDTWFIVSTPVSTQSIPDFLTDASNNVPTKALDYGMMYYSEAGGNWVYYTDPASGEFTSGHGYLLRHTTDDAVLTGGTLSSATTDINISRDGNGWNCIGNPFPSSVGVRSTASTSNTFLIYNAAELDPSYAVLYLWDEPAVRDAGVSYYKLIGNAGFSTSRPTIDQDYLQPGQGFFVKSVSGGGTISFTAAMRDHDNTASFVKAAEASWPGINLLATSESKSASTAITFNENMSTGLDVTFDAGHFGGDPAFKLYTRLVEDNGVNFMLQCLPDNAMESMSIPIGLDFSAGGMVSFSAEATPLPEGYFVMLEDRLLDEFTNLEEASSSYSVEIEAGAAETGRFFLHVSEEVNGIGQINQAGINIYTFNKVIYIKGDISDYTHANMYDNMGRMIRQYNLHHGGALNELPANEIPGGVYFLKLVGEGKYENGRVVLDE